MGTKLLNNGLLQTVLSFESPELSFMILSESHLGINIIIRTMLKKVKIAKDKNIALHPIIGKKY